MATLEDFLSPLSLLFPSFSLSVSSFSEILICRTQKIPPPLIRLPTVTKKSLGLYQVCLVFGKWIRLTQSQDMLAEQMPMLLVLSRWIPWYVIHGLSINHISIFLDSLLGWLLFCLFSFLLGFIYLNYRNCLKYIDFCSHTQKLWCIQF